MKPEFPAPILALIISTPVLVAFRPRLLLRSEAGRKGLIGLRVLVGLQPFSVPAFGWGFAGCRVGGASA